MFELFRRRRITRLTEAARTYAAAKYTIPRKQPASPSSLGEGIRFSARSAPADNYDCASIGNAVRSLSSDAGLSDALRAIEANTNMSFVDKLLEHINSRHMRDSDVYKAAQLDRRLFSKIVSDRAYKPAKDTCIALSLALRLSLPEAEDFLSRAGYVLSHSSKRDVVIEYFFRERIYNLNDVNEILYRLGEKAIGR